jgi:hypothetical protein
VILDDQHAYRLCGAQVTKAMTNAGWVPAGRLTTIGRMRGSGPYRLVALLLVCVTAASVSAACGGGGGSGSGSAGATTGPAKVAVNDWVGAVCTSVSTWQKSLTATPNITNPSDLEATKTAVTDFLGKVVSATNTMLAEVKAAGVPDTDNGEAIANAFSGSLSTLGTAFEHAKSEVEGLSTTDATGLVTGLQNVATELTQAASKLSTAFDDLAKKYPAADLSATAKNNPACSAIVGG